MKKPNRILVWHFFAIQALFSHFILFAQQEKHLDGMIGNCDPKIFWIIDTIQSANQKNLKQKQIPINNRLLLHGPPGNGKSTIAKKISKASDARLFLLDGPSIVGRYVGQGAENIEILFDEVEKYTATTQQPAIVFIDEIDAIAANNTSEFRAEHAIALQKLWLYLDRHKNNPLIFFICATNFFNKLNKAFLDRFGCNTIEIGNPDKKLRELVIQHYFALYGVAINQKLIQKLARASDSLSIRSLEDFARDAHIRAHINKCAVSSEKDLIALLKEIKLKFANNTSDSDSAEQISKVNNITSILHNTSHFLLNCCALYTIISTWTK